LTGRVRRGTILQDAARPAKDLILNPAGYHHNMIQSVTSRRREANMRYAIVLILAWASIDAALAAEQAIELKRAPGVERVEANCGSCHSLDYLPTNSPFLNAASWQAEVNKMINAFGAPIDEADAKIITEYLIKNYGG